MTIYKGDKADLEIPVNEDYEIHVFFQKKKIKLRLYQPLFSQYLPGYITVKDPEALKTKLKRDTFGKKILELLDDEQVLALIDEINYAMEEARRKKAKKYVKQETMVKPVIEPDPHLLEDPYLLHDIMDVIRRYPLVNEDVNGLTTFLAIFSGQTKYPISIVIEGLSSSGKNTIIRAAQQVIPEEWIQYFTASTPEAIKYLDPKFQGTLIIYEAAGITSQTGALGLRSIGEGESIKTIMPIRDESGKMVLYEHETNARNFVTTTTRVDVEQELATRIFTLSTNDDPDTTRKVVEKTLDLAWTPKSLRAILYDDRPRIDPQIIRETLKSVDWMKYEAIVFLPSFLEKMSLLTPRLRRDVKKIVNLIRVLAVLNHRKRTIIRVENNYYVLAGLEDVYIAMKIANEIFRSTFTGLTKRLQEAYELCLKLNIDQFTVKDVQAMYQKEGKKVGYTTVYRYLEQLTDLGYLYKDSSGRQNQYQVARYDVTDIQISIDKNYIQQYRKKVEERLSELEGLKKLKAADIEIVQLNLDETIIDPFTGKEVTLDA